MQGKQKETRRKLGFTLVELLVVIAVIAVLAAILFPALMAAQERANQTKCMANLRQLAIALNDYASTNRGRFPGVNETPIEGLVWSNGRTDDGIWASRVDGYIGGSEDLWVCPTFHEIGIEFREQLETAEVGIPYGINNSLTMRRESDGVLIGRPASAPDSPRTTILLVENDGYDAGGLLGGEPSPAPRHLRGNRMFNIVFCDSNAEVVETTRYPEDWDLE